MPRASSPVLRVLLFVVSTQLGCAADSPPADAGSDTASAHDANDGGARACTSAATCSDGLYCNGEETCTAGVCAAGVALTCSDAIVCTIDRCNDSRRACENAPPDADHDGFTDASCHDASGAPLGTDCDDHDATRFPGNHEVCDAAGHDEDCNLATYGARDMDHDGHDDIACCNTGGACGDDCNDADPSVNPSITEVCNHRDDDCDTHVDEGLAINTYRPDCDLDGYGDDAATPIMDCAAPLTMPSCGASTGAWVLIGGDCADHDPNRNGGNPEVCNDIDDDCDHLVDDIIHGTVICHAGQTMACTTTCSVSGLQTCAATCLGYAPACIAPEVCNGCDDDANGRVDDGFMCAQGTSEACTVATCGTTGTHVCSSSCTWGTCAATEICNYCDDNGNGNYFEERPLASVTASDHYTDCGSFGGAYAMFGGHTSCFPIPTGGGSQDMWATLIDGTSNNQAGALWFDPSPQWTQGWGPTETTIDLDVTAMTAGGVAEIPLGGWAVIFGRGGTTGVGTPQNRGIPTAVQGVAASWFWSNFDSCYMPSSPPSHDDSVRFTSIGAAGLGTARATPSAPDWGCFSGDLTDGTAADFDGVSSGTITERLQFRYTPDDPTTAAVNEEQVRIIASTPGVGSSITYVYTPSNNLPLGSAPLRIGITAGSYTQSGFTTGGATASMVFGVPVRARVRIWHQQHNCCSPDTFTYPVVVTRTAICP